MNNISQADLISQMQSLESMSKGNMKPVDQKIDDGTSFSSMMSRAINQVNETQMDASSMRKAFELGDDTVDLSEVMIAVQKSRISFEALSQVRNKLLNAYQDVMNMPV
ncbi:MAG: flagellar hook-basal body complex protein FliE [Gammaproteobacteria bacterium]|jgi:flagellar hook-basal body complex protein FliE